MFLPNNENLQEMNYVVNRVYNKRLFTTKQFRAGLQQNSKSSLPVTVLRIGDLWRTWMIPNWYIWVKVIPWSSRINFVPFRIFRGPLLKKSNWSGTFFTFSYSKLALLDVLLTNLCHRFPFDIISCAPFRLPYACHYKPRFVYSKPTFWFQKRFFNEVF